MVNINLRDGSHCGNAPGLVTIHEPRLQDCADHPRLGILAIHPVSQRSLLFRFEVTQPSAGPELWGIFLPLPIHDPVQLNHLRDTGLAARQHSALRI